MLNEIKYHADNLNQILEIEGEEGQFEYLIDIGKNGSCFQDIDRNEDNKMSHANRGLSEKNICE